MHCILSFILSFLVISFDFFVESNKRRMSERIKIRAKRWGQRRWGKKRRSMMIGVSRIGVSSLITHKKVNYKNDIKSWCSSSIKINFFFFVLDSVVLVMQCKEARRLQSSNLFLSSLILFSMRKWRDSSSLRCENWRDNYMRVQLFSPLTASHDDFLRQHFIQFLHLSWQPLYVIAFSVTELQKVRQRINRQKPSLREKERKTLSWLWWILSGTQINWTSHHQNQRKETRREESSSHR